MFEKFMSALSRAYEKACYIAFGNYFADLLHQEARDEFISAGVSEQDAETLAALFGMQDSSAFHFAQYLNELTPDELNQAVANFIEWSEGHAEEEIGGHALMIIEHSHEEVVLDPQEDNQENLHVGVCECSSDEEDH
ncbi:MAG: hypothetical protein K0T99_03790 [Alphaproteobacteria bacterium]|nr:hypothetical protein [Alphaproteobacteria bacterium]